MLYFYTLPYKNYLLESQSGQSIGKGYESRNSCDFQFSNEELRRIFGIYGEVKEIRETPHRNHHKFIEYYNVRAAEDALKALNRCDIAGKRIKILNWYWNRLHLAVLVGFLGGTHLIPSFGN